MITGELKNKIDGLVNPLEVIEQITYLMFIHDLDDVDNTRAKESAMLGLPFQSIFAEEVKIGERTIDGTQLKWSVFHDFPADRMYSIMQEWVFPFIKTLHSDKTMCHEHLQALISFPHKKSSGKVHRRTTNQVHLFAARNILANQGRKY